MSGFLASALLHAALLVALALITQAIRTGVWGSDISARLAPKVPEPLEAEYLITVERHSHVHTTTIADVGGEMPEVDLPVETPSRSHAILQQGIGLQDSLPSNWLAQATMVANIGLGDRSPQGRARMVGAGGDGGPSRESEEAVERGLGWLAAHQRRDGSWHFNHHKSLCNGMCRDPGTVGTTTGATAMALLAFLGAGYTQQGGQYSDVVRRGLYYLQSRAVVTENGIDLQEGTMYAQGLAAIALSEAYAMTGDPWLRELASGAADWIVYAQDRQGGGWRYSPHEAGDTTVTGWQIMALKSSDMAGLPIPSPAWLLAQRFLDSVQSEEGARYGYMSTDPRRLTTAVGLLCRMYGGWGHNHDPLQRGVAYLCDWGPAENDIYYNYYATQVLFHWQGSDWKRWDRDMRDHLVATQATAGHESGSWYFPEKSTAPGGRLCSTTLAIMTLEVYYRYMPLYGKQVLAK
jgi:hypothetical protein